MAAVMLMAASASSLEAAPKAPLAIPINVVGLTGGTFNGTLNITGFANQNGQLVALGTLVGTVTNAGGAASAIVQAIVLPLLNPPNGTCDILHLELGPLDLDLLGVKVHLDKVVLDITAQAGPGNLLGNLLCSVAHLLDASNLNALIGQLNHLLDVLLGL
jgi:hypothetical protein